MLYWYLGGGVLLLVAAVLLISYICYRIAFYMPRKKVSADASVIPMGDFMRSVIEASKKAAEQIRELPREEVCITSFDGLKLYGYYFEYAPGAPIEIMVHGYRGSALGDLSGGVLRCFRMGRSILLVDQRCCGKSEGRTITFGAKEHLDCLAWVDFAVQKFGPDVKLILSGVSMGASTVLMAGGKALPSNVIGILADCGYSSAEAIIKNTIKDMRLPIGLGYLFVKLGARLYGGFNIDDASPEKLLKNCKIPVLFIHGEKDSFVPCHMSQKNYDACAGRKRLVTVPNADHGMAYMTDPPRYLQELGEFFGPEASAKVPQQKEELYDFL